MSSPIVRRLTDEADRAKNKLSNLMRRKREEKTEAVETSLVVAGGGIGGFVDAQLGEGTEEAEVAGLPLVPVLAIVASIGGWYAKSNELVAMGKGLGAYALGTEVRKKVGKIGE